MSHREAVCVDLDGVLAQYDVWKGPDVIGDPIEGARVFLEVLHKRYDVIVFTCREADRVWSWLEQHGMKPFVKYVNYCDVNGACRKPMAAAYIDDRAIRFHGNFTQTLLQLGPWR